MIEWRADSSILGIHAYTYAPQIAVLFILWKPNLDLWTKGTSTLYLKTGLLF